MTQREFFNKVLNANINEEMNAKATELIAQLDKANDRKKSATSKAKTERAEFMNKIIAVLKEKGHATGAEIAAALEVNTSKVTSIITYYGEGIVTRTSEKIEGVKGKRTVYRLTDVE